MNNEREKYKAEVSDEIHNLFKKAIDLKNQANELRKIAYQKYTEKPPCCTRCNKELYIGGWQKGVYFSTPSHQLCRDCQYWD